MNKNSASNIVDPEEIGSVAPVIREFRLLAGTKYYLGEEIELRWNVRNVDKLYLNGQLLDKKKGTKTIKYNTVGNKRLTLKCTKGEYTVRRIITLSIENAPKVCNPLSSRNDNLSQEKKTEETKVITAEIVDDAPKGEKPTIQFFWRAGNQPLYVGDEVTFHWGVADAACVAFMGQVVDKKITKKTILLKEEGPVRVSLVVSNQFGRAKTSIVLDVLKRNNVSLPVIKRFECSKTNDVSVGEPVYFTWDVDGASEVRLGWDNKVAYSGSSSVTFSKRGTYTYTLFALQTGCDTVKRSITINVNRGSATIAQKQPSAGHSLVSVFITAIIQVCCFIFLVIPLIEYAAFNNGNSFWAFCAFILSAFLPWYIWYKQKMK